MAAWPFFDKNQEAIQMMMHPPSSPSTSFQRSWHYHLGDDLENMISAKAVRAASLLQALVTGLKMACDRSLATYGSWDFIVVGGIFYQLFE